MNAKTLRLQRDDVPAGGAPTTPEDQHQLMERLLGQEPAVGGGPGSTAGRAHGGENWVDAYLAHYGEETVGPRASQGRAHSERWVEEYLAYYDGETP